MNLIATLSQLIATILFYNLNISMFLGITTYVHAHIRLGN